MIDLHPISKAARRPRRRVAATIAGAALAMVIAWRACGGAPSPEPAVDCYIDSCDAGTALCLYRERSWWLDDRLDSAAALTMASAAPRLGCTTLNGRGLPFDEQ